VGPLLLAFVLLPFLELMLLIRIGRVVGVGSTLALLVLTGLLGAWLAKRQGRKVLEAWRTALAAGQVPEEGVLGGVLVLIGGLLLVTPGVLTDVLGLFCLLPPTRKLIARGLGRYLSRQVARGAQVHSYGFEWPPRPPTSPAPPTRPTGPVRPTQGARKFDPSRAPINSKDVIDTEGEEV
jgi:UPF0716 protein FxsA